MVIQKSNKQTRLSSGKCKQISIARKAKHAFSGSISLHLISHVVGSSFPRDGEPHESCRREIVNVHSMMDYVREKDEHNNGDENKPRDDHISQ